MKLEMNAKNRAIAVAVAFAVLAFVFWTQLLSPKRDEAKQLGVEVERLEASLAAHEAEIAVAEEAKRSFAGDYQRLVVVGKAVPGDDDVASLLVQVNRLSDKAGGTFRDMQLSSEGGGEEAAAPPPAPGAEPASPTEVAAALLPLGASVGPAGLAVMPYTVTFDGNFFEIADFIKGIDSLVEHDARRGRRQRPAGHGQRLLARGRSGQGLPCAAGQLRPDNLSDAAGRGRDRRGDAREPG